MTSTVGCLPDSQRPTPTRRPASWASRATEETRATVIALPVPAWHLDEVALISGLSGLGKNMGHGIIEPARELARGACDTRATESGFARSGRTRSTRCRCGGGVRGTRQVVLVVG